MLHNSPELPQHLILALDHHRWLLEKAQCERKWMAAHASKGERPLRGHRLRVHLGEWLIKMGQRLKAHGPE